MKGQYTFGANPPSAEADAFDLNPATIAACVGQKIAACSKGADLDNNFSTILHRVNDTFKTKVRDMKPKNTFQGIQQAHEEGNTSGIPGTLSTQVTQRLMCQTLQGWDDIIDCLLNDFNNEACNMINQSLLDYEGTSIYATASKFLHGRMEVWMETSGTSIKKQLGCQKYQPYCGYDTWKASVGTRTTAIKDAVTRRGHLEHYIRDEIIECSAMISLFYDYICQNFACIIVTNLEHDVMRHLRSNKEITDALREALLQN